MGAKKIINRDITIDVTTPKTVSREADVAYFYDKDEQADKSQSVIFNTGQS